MYFCATNTEVHFFMAKQTYNLHLKGYVGGWDFESDYVDYILECKVCCEFFVKEITVPSMLFWLKASTLRNPVHFCPPITGEPKGVCGVYEMSLPRGWKPLPCAKAS